jgi:hypothetical protein
MPINVNGMLCKVNPQKHDLKFSQVHFTFTLTTPCRMFRKKNTDKSIRSFWREILRDTDLRVVLQVKEVSPAGLRGAQLVAGTHLEQHVT